MKLTCPYCETRGPWMDIHRHLAEDHVAQVLTEIHEESGKMTFTLPCPFCDERATHEVNPRGRNPRFIQEFRAEIALVAFDQLLYHLAAAHPGKAAIDPPPESPTIPTPNT